MKVAVVGAGRMGVRHAATLRLDPRVERLVVFDVDVSRRVPSAMDDVDVPTTSTTSSTPASTPRWSRRPPIDMSSTSPGGSTPGYDLLREAAGDRDR